MRRRRVLLAVAALAVAAAVTGPTGGFTATAADRPVEVAVADDDRALLTLYDPGVGSEGPPPRAVAAAGLAGEDPVANGSDRVRVLAVLNRFRTPVTVDGAARSTPETVTVTGVDPVELAPAEAAGLTARVDCGDRRGPVTVALAVHASGDGVTVRTTTTATVVCNGPAGGAGNGGG